MHQKMSKVKIVHISVTFLLKTFFWCIFFKNFLTDSKTAFFYTHIELQKNFFALLSTFVNFANAHETAQKKENLFL